jgi:hypothetical protein
MTFCQLLNGHLDDQGKLADQKSVVSLSKALTGMLATCKSRGFLVPILVMARKGLLL